MIFIHYGHKHFDKQRFIRSPHRNGEVQQLLNKPSKGFWGSPINSKNSWRDFCLSEDFRVSSLNKYFVFALKKSARVLKVMNTTDMLYLYRKYGMRGDHGRQYLDWKRITKSYDAMVLMIPTNNFDLLCDLNLTSWDVDSVVVFNPDVIVELPERERAQ